ncbi:MAG: hypothetical protein JXB39_15095 [Deltaproteobacteria bacterium]|nr:hypothetical protein [Deltaproteobacteria bacterium]
MTPDLLRIAGLLRALSVRERRCLAVRAVLQGLAVAGLAGGLAVGLALGHVSRPAAPLVFTLLTGLGLLLAVSIPAARRWRPAGDPVRQARRVEAQRPRLRGRLVTVAERLEGARPGESEALLARATTLAAGDVAGLDARHVHVAPPLGLPGLAAILAVGGLVACTVLAPIPPLRALAWIFGPAGAVEGIASDPLAGPEDEALVGDIDLRYLYPPYTGRDPLEVFNSTGDVHAPPGTTVEIRARTAEAWESARLRFVPATGEAGAPPVPEDVEASLLSGRSVSTSIEVRAAGAWHLVLGRTGQEYRSRTHDVVVEPDLPPEVLLDAPTGTLDVAWDEAIPVIWTARDDYGVARVEAVVDRTEGPSPSPRVLRAPLDPAERLSEALDATPLDLGLVPGEAGRVRVVAWDDDAVSGSKAGASRVLALRVLGPRGKTARKVKRIEELRGVLVGALADYLEEGWPAGDTGPALLAWGERVAQRMEPLDTLADAWWEGFDPSTFEGTVVVAVRATHASLLTFVQVLGARPDRQAVPQEDRVHLEVLRDATITTLERGILTLDEAILREAVARLAELARQIARETAPLPGIEDPVSLHVHLDSVSRQLEGLDRAAEDLGESPLSALVAARVRDARNRIALARDALAQGRVTDARRILVALARDAQDLASIVEDAMAAGEGAVAEAMARVEALARELADLEENEREEVERIARFRAALGDDPESLAARWDAVGQRARALVRRSERNAEAMRGDGWSYTERSLSAAVASEAHGLLRALDAHDVDRSVGAAGEMEWSVTHLEQVAARYTEGRQAIGRVAGGERVVLGSLGEAEAEAVAVRRMLEDLVRSLARPSAPLCEAAREAATRQETVEERVVGATREAGDLARSLPMGAPGLVEGLEGASEAVHRSVTSLGDGQAMAGEGAARSAADALAEAGRALERAIEDARDLSRFSARREAQASSGSRRGAGASPDVHGRMEIPAPEAFRTPEAYRRALLRGMEGKVPDEYETLKRRYYEELVRQ